MKKTKTMQSPRLIQNVFVLLLLALFACLSVFLVMVGAQAYRGTVDRADINNDHRIAAALVRSAVWAQDGGVVRIEDHEGMPALAIEDNYDGEIYIKRLFCRDGWLMESYTSEERGFDPEDGEELCELSAFAPRKEGGILTVHLTAPDGSESDVLVRLRAGGADE